MALCKPSLTTILKQEVASREPSWRQSFHKKGFITWKIPSASPLSSISSSLHVSHKTLIDKSFIFAQRLGIGIFKGTRDEKTTWMNTFITLLNKHDLRFHVDEIHTLIWDKKEIPSSSYKRIASSGIPHSGDLILTFVAVPHTSQDPMWYACIHTHTEALCGDIGGLFLKPLPSTSPSRAWLKFEETYQRFLTIPGIQAFPQNAHILEIGACPGGVTSNLLQRGFRVTAVDPGVMDDALQRNKQLHHIQQGIHRVSISSLPMHVHGLIVDINAESLLMLPMLENIFQRYTSCPFIMLTCKLPDLEHFEYVSLVCQEIQRLLPQRQWVFTHLTANGCEFTAIGYDSQLH
jgi:hypothetical protein